MSPTDEERIENTARHALSAARGGMSPAVKRAVRGRVMAAARSETKRGAWLLVSRRAAVAFALTLALSGGVAYGAAVSLPGDALYPIKRTSEAVALELMPDGALRDAVLARIAERRAVEAMKLALNGAEAGVFDHAIDELGQAVRAAFADGGMPEPEAQRLRERAADVPVEERARIESAIGAQQEPSQGSPAPAPAPAPSPSPEPGAPGGSEPQGEQGGAGPSGNATQTPQGQRGP